MPWISNHKHRIEEKLTKSSRSPSKVVGLRPADLWEGISNTGWDVEIHLFDDAMFECVHWCMMIRSYTYHQHDMIIFQNVSVCDHKCQIHHRSSILLLVKIEWQVCSSDGLNVCLSLWMLLAGYRSLHSTNHHPNMYPSNGYKPICFLGQRIQ